MTCLPLTATPGGCLVVMSQSLVLPVRGGGVVRVGHSLRRSSARRPGGLSPAQQPGLLTPLAPEASDATHAS